MSRIHILTVNSLAGQHTEVFCDRDQAYGTGIEVVTDHLRRLGYTADDIANEHRESKAQTFANLCDPVSDHGYSSGVEAAITTDTLRGRADWTSTVYVLRVLAECADDIRAYTERRAAYVDAADIVRDSQLGIGVHPIDIDEVCVLGDPEQTTAAYLELAQENGLSFVLSVTPAALRAPHNVGADF